MVASSERTQEPRNQELYINSTTIFGVRRQESPDLTGTSVLHVKKGWLGHPCVSGSDLNEMIAVEALRKP